MSSNRIDRSYLLDRDPYSMTCTYKNSGNFSNVGEPARDQILVNVLSGASCELRFDLHVDRSSARAVHVLITYFTEQIVDERFFGGNLSKFFQFDQGFLIPFKMQQKTSSRRTREGMHCSETIIVGRCRLRTCEICRGHFSSQSSVHH